jgi:hypothetical protein
MNFEEIQSLLINYSEQSAANQAAAVFEALYTSKSNFL